jgi:hypothetical protein
MVQHSHSHRPSAVGVHMGLVPEEVDSRMAEAVVLHLVEEGNLQDGMVQVDSEEGQEPIREVEGMYLSEDNSYLHTEQHLLVQAAAYTALDYMALRTGHGPHRYHVLQKC